MSMMTSCPNCGTKARAPDNLAGKKVRCPKCKAQFVLLKEVVGLELAEDTSVAVEETGSDDSDPPVLEDSNALSHSENTSTSTRRSETPALSSSDHNFASRFVYCRKCGKQISRKSIACPVCGAPMEIKIPVRPPHDPSRRSPILEKLRMESKERIESAKTPNYVLIGGAFLVLVGCFFPWFVTTNTVVNAFELEHAIRIGASQSILDDQIQIGPKFHIGNLFRYFSIVFKSNYLLPLLAIMIIALEFFTLKQKKRFEKTSSSLICLTLLICLNLLLFVFLLQSDIESGVGKAWEQENKRLLSILLPSFWDFIGFGYWLALIGAMTAIISDMVKTGAGRLILELLCMILMYYGLLFILIVSSGA